MEHIDAQPEYDQFIVEEMNVKCQAALNDALSTVQKLKIPNFHQKTFNRMYASVLKHYYNLERYKYESCGCSFVNVKPDEYIYKIPQERVFEFIEGLKVYITHGKEMTVLLRQMK